MRELFIKEKILEVYKECGIHSFPIDCFKMLRHYGFNIRTYAEAKAKDLELYKAICSYSDDAVKFYKSIYYNQSTNARRIRFSLMHELAHHVLEHIGESKTNEDEADFFASNILAPRQIMYQLHCVNADDIHATFDISYAAANRAIKDYHQWTANDIDKKISTWFFPPEAVPAELEAEKVKDVEIVPEEPTSKVVWIPSKEFEERRARALARIQRRKKKIQKQLKEYEEDMDFLGFTNSDKFRRAEYQRLYGNDL